MAAGKGRARRRILSTVRRALGDPLRFLGVYSSEWLEKTEKKGKKNAFHSRGTAKHEENRKTNQHATVSYFNTTGHQVAKDLREGNVEKEEGKWSGSS